MSDRQSTLLWIRDLIDHMNRCHEQLEDAQGGSSESFLTDALLMDLTECRRLCEQLRTRSRQGMAYSG